MNDRDALQSEFNEIGTLIRHYGGLRIGTLTVFFALVAGLVTVGFDPDQKANQFALLTVRIWGVISTFVFLVLEHKIGSYLTFLEKRISEVEGKLGYNVYSGRLKAGRRVRGIRTHYAINLLFLSVLVFWFASFFFA